jgi:hypothetical protein
MSERESGAFVLGIVTGLCVGFAFCWVAMQWMP